MPSTIEQRRTERRERILDAGLQLFGTDGYPATSIERLCAEAGVSTRNFYEAFPGREAVLVALHDRVSDAARNAVEAALARVGNVGTQQRFEAGVTAYLGVVCTDPRWARIVFAEVQGVSPLVEESRLRWRDRYVEMLVAEACRATARGEAADRDHGLTALAFIAAVDELAYRWVRCRPVPLAEITAELTRLAVAALL